MKERSGMPYDVVAFETDENALALSSQEEGIFHRMMRKAWINGSVPADLVELAGLCRERPTTLQKAWPHLSKMWFPMVGDPSRLVNKKQESERIFRKKIRALAVRAGKLSGKARRLKKEERTDVQRNTNGRSTPLPSPSLPVPIPLPLHFPNTEKSPIPPHSPVSTGCAAAEEMLAVYNAERGSLPEVRSLTQERVRKCNARTKHTNGNFLSDFKLAIQRARVLPFCLGEGAQGWRLDFDFLIANDTNYQKILEGKYDHVRTEQREKTKADLTREACERVLALSDSETGGDG